MRPGSFKIVSGGQTGADRAALDWAIAHNVPHGGWCPAGRKAEDGPLPARYLLEETPNGDYIQRTEWNVRDSDATVILSIQPALGGGSRKTLETARRLGKPCLVISRLAPRGAPALLLQEFIEEHSVRTLNVAGPRASEEAEVGPFVREVLDAWHADMAAEGRVRESLATRRLRLRPFALSDIPGIAALACRREIADTTRLPHPYTEADAREWILRQRSAGALGQEVAFAITLGERLIGAVGLRAIDAENSQAELGFWIGVEYWGQGYATEAAAAVVDFGFERLKLNRIYAHHLARNPASGRVLQKLGMQLEGRLRQKLKKWDVFEDVMLLAILAEDRKRGGPVS